MLDEEKTILRLAIIFCLSVCHTEYGQRMDEAMETLQKYSPEVLLSGGKPIECLEETKMKYDEEGTGKRNSKFK